MTGLVGKKGSITIRRFDNWDEYVQSERVQAIAWEMPDARDIVPAHLLITADKNGGLVLGAFDGPRLVGFVFGFPGIDRRGGEAHIKHCSHLLAVLPDYRRLGLAFELKRAQRMHLLEQGIDLCTWTFDPLQAANARLNLTRLGAIAGRYIRDAYGEMLDGVNRGIASDRFQVEWWLDTLHVQERLDRKAGQESTPPEMDLRVLRVEVSEGGLPRVREMRRVAGDRCIVEIPADVNRLKARNLALAQEWRAYTRRAFESCFANGYTAVDLIDWKEPDGSARAGFLLLKAAVGP